MLSSCSAVSPLCSALEILLVGIKQDRQSLPSCFGIRQRPQPLTRACENSIDFPGWSIERLGRGDLPKDGVLYLGMNQLTDLLPLRYDWHQLSIAYKG